MEYIPAKTIVTKTKAPSQWFGIDYNMNIYKGCCHGCIYCDSRSDCYQIEEFDRVRAKENALQIIRRAEAAGARFIYPAFGMTLRGNQRDWYFRKLEELFPEEGLADRYRKRYGNYYECRSPRAKKLWEYFAGECENRGIVYRMEDIIGQYKRPYRVEQLSLF